MSLNLESKKYIPDYPEIKDAEDMMTEDQKKMSEERLQEFFKKCRKEGWSWAAIEAVQENANNGVYHSIFDHMNQKDYVEYFIKNLPDNALIETTSNSHCSGDFTSAVVSVAEIKQALKNCEESVKEDLQRFAEDDNDLQESDTKAMEDLYLGFGAVSCGYHDYDDMQLIGIPSDKIEDIEENIEKAGIVSTYLYLTPNIEEKEILNSGLKFKTLPNGEILIKREKVIGEYEGTTITGTEVYKSEDFKKQIEQENSDNAFRIEEIENEIESNVKTLEEIDKLTSK